ncbi:hypothetical protein [Parachitinimonas caeni]|uniref:Uncharacterized protein n=1 Tax=Parachitinimonas caeni TaxID=3031301 RepID=A0ABT7DZG2_9NEIS|nr:hypothetical protein [Parachitinimonas caeni]MDK2125448.1 hypothetical protein [Parachitinimonas caeni]
MMHVNATTMAAEELNAPVRRKTTSVGFEFDLWTADQKNNPYFGLTHFCLAKSTEGFGDFELPYFLETDAHSTIELVTPPYSVEVEEGTNSVPDKTQFQALKSNVTAEVQEVANKFNGKTLAEATEDVWKINGHGIGWERSEEVPASNHWNVGAGQGKDVIKSVTGSRIKRKDFDFKLENKGKSKGKLDPPQVNFATYLYELDKASENVGMEKNGRVTVKEVFGKFINPESFIKEFEGAPYFLRNFITSSVGSTIASFAIKRAGDIQVNWMNEGKVDKKMTQNEEAITGIASYIKDLENFWVKTDPVTALASSKLEIIKDVNDLKKMESGREEVKKGVDCLDKWIGENSNSLAGSINPNAGIWKNYVQLLLNETKDKKVVEEYYVKIRTKIIHDITSMKNGLLGLLSAMNNLLEVAAENGDSKFNIEAQRKILIEYIKSRDLFLGNKGTEMHIDNPEMLGCRQDTYIAPSKTFRGWGSDDGESVEGIKVVVEGRNPKS